MAEKKDILFLTPYPRGTAGSQRFRFELFYGVLEKENISFDTQSFVDEETWQILYLKGGYYKKILGVLKGFLRRVKTLFVAKKYKYIFIHREASPLGPPIFEFILSKWLKSKIIFDFDDAIWKRDINKTNKLATILKRPQKVERICKWAYKVSAGNTYLASYAKQFSKNVFIIPTVVDTENRHNRIQKQDSLVVNIGWTGTHTTLKYLYPIVSVIESLQNKYDFIFYVIANKKPEWNLKSLEFIKWDKETEIEDLMRFHIGLMPLIDDEWANGKCGFKAIQYMSLGIVPIVSPVGVNREIVSDGIQGLYANSMEDWRDSIEKLLIRQDSRIVMGEESRNSVKQGYSVLSLKDDFMKLFRC